MSENNYGAMMIKSAVGVSDDINAILSPGIYIIPPGNTSSPDTTGGALIVHSGIPVRRTFTSDSVIALVSTRNGNTWSSWSGPLSRKNPFGDIKSDGATAIDKALENLGLVDTVTKAAGAIQRSGDDMDGPLGLTRTSSFGVGTENALGGNSIAIGDNDSGFKSNGDGNIALMANGVLAGYFSENELQHHEKVLTKIFRAISTGNATEGAGGLGSQLTSGAPFYSPAIVRQNNDNNYFPLWKQIVSLQSGYPVAASMGLLTTGKPNFPQIVLHAKTDFEVNDKLWVFDVASGEFRSPGRLLGTEIFLSGKTRIGSDGNINGEVWGGWLNDYLYNTYNKKNTATLGFSGWSRDESTGLIMQWGNVDNARGTYTFPRAFNQTCFAVFATNKDGQGGAIDNAYGYPVSNTQFFLSSKANSGQDTAYGISWFALGY